MSATKLHKILKKYREKHRIHKESWDKVYVPKIEGILTRSHETQCHNFAAAGSRIFDEMMKELEGVEVFPKKTK
tara:strand:- start:2464 stop:2685 length:222 start_codon:yes stop_codon:yes gene_type:complete